MRASEATIYERYGYGVASSSQTVEIQTARAASRPDVGSGGPVRLLDAAQAWDVLPRIYAENRPSRPGTIDRSAVWWQGLRLRTEMSSGPSYVAVHGRPGSESGRPAELHVDIEGLAAVLLGGATWRSLAVAGLVRATDAAALPTADRLFAVSEAPFAGFYF